MAIKELITLEGAEEIKRTIADLGKSGEDFVKKLNAAGTGGKVPFADITKAAKDAGIGMGSATKPANELRQALYVLRPIASQLGIQMGSLGNLSRLAGVGFQGLAIAGIAVAATEMAKLQDAAAAALKQLTGLFESASQGQAAFKQMKTDADSLGISYSHLLPHIQAYTLAMEAANKGGPAVVTAPGHEPPDFANTAKAADTLYKIIRAGATDTKQADTALAAFDAELRRGGTVTGEMIRQLRAAGIDVTLLDSILHGSTINARAFAEQLDKVPIAIQRLNLLLSQATAKVDEFVKAQNANQIKPFSDALEHLWESFKNLATGPGAIGVVVTAITEGLAKIVDAINIMTSSDTWAKAWQAFKADAIKYSQEAWDGIKQIFSLIPFDLTSWLPSFDNFWTGIKNAAQNTWNWIKDLFSQSLPNPATQSPGSVGGGPFFEPPGGAGGGLFHGRPGIDTNLAWLTDIEYIMKPAAVRKYGVNFMHMINSLQFPIRGFSEGGLNLMDRASISPPSISAMQSSRSLTLVLDTKRFNISGSRSTIDALEREATLRGISAAGIAPGWVR